MGTNGHEICQKSREHAQETRILVVMVRELGGRVDKQSVVFLTEIPPPGVGVIGSWFCLSNAAVINQDASGGC